MPVYEYRCLECNTDYDVYHKSTTSQEDISCPECKSEKTTKKLSVFAASVHGNAPVFDGNCSDGSCAPQYGGGCAGGMCGLN